MSSFADFQLPAPLDEVLASIGYETPTPVQAKAIPLVLQGKDVLATAQTGTGKTAAFALPLIAKMLGGWKKTVLIVAPTRELAEQIGQVLKQLTEKTPELRTSVIIGGMAYLGQIRSLRNKPAFVVGTPGRLIDQVDQGHLKLSDCGALVIDEADRLLDMGFEPQVKAIVSHLPRERQSLMFSATMPNSILSLANSFLREPVRVAIGAVSKPVDRIKQDVVQTTTKEKDETLISEIDKVAGSILIFCKTKIRTEKVAKLLDRAGHNVARIHGDRSQNQRSQAISAFRSGEARILVATDIAARGIDIPHIQHVVNYDLPVCAEDYVHRIGRTARAGAEGHSLAFVTPEENRHWNRIYKIMHGHFPPNSTGGGGVGAGPGTGRKNGKGGGKSSGGPSEHAGARTTGRPNGRFEKRTPDGRPANRAQRRAEGQAGENRGQQQITERRKPRPGGPKQNGGSAKHRWAKNNGEGRGANAK